MRVLGIDPGLQVTGWGIVEGLPNRPGLVEAGIVRTTESAPLEKRLREIYSGIREVMREHRPAVVAIEDLYSHYRHPTTAILMGHARGVIFLAAANARTPVVAYSATRIKKCITGNGRAGKSQVQRMVAAALGLGRVPEPHDVADALAAALTHLNDTRRVLS